VSDTLEDKYARGEIQFGGEPRYFNASIGSTTECYPLLPQVQAGAEGHERVGDKIRPKSLRVDFTICANGSISSSMMHQIRLFILEDKGIKTLSLLAQTPIDTQLLDLGNVVAGFSGFPNQILQRVNKRRYKVFHDKVMVVGKGTNQTPNAGNGYVGTQTVIDKLQVHKFSVRIPTPAVLNYVNPLDNYPSNFAPFMCLGYVQPDGSSSVLDFGTLRVGCNFVSHLDYEDA